ncbi:MAG: type I methionyl aminopeptidase [Chitinophagales bacterium]|nr:type I methionyl aminopeptidase [Chitinophagales bacterium]
MIHYKTSEDIEIMSENAMLVNLTHAMLVPFIKPGVTLRHIDHLAYEYVKDHNAEPAFLGFNGFPASMCISVNDEIVHGIPSDREIQEGDLLSLDFGVYKNGFYGDSAYTFPVAVTNPEHLKLLRVTVEALDKGIEQIYVGNRLGDVGFAIQEHTEKKNGYGVVRELIGHGIGRDLHESPNVPNYGRRGNGLKITNGLVICVEPMINLGTYKVKQLNDGWTIVTADGSMSAHFEHTIAVQKDEAQVLTNFDIINKEIKKSEYITDFQ